MHVITQADLVLQVIKLGEVACPSIAFILACYELCTMPFSKCGSMTMIYIINILNVIRNVLYHTRHEISLLDAEHLFQYISLAIAEGNPTQAMKYLVLFFMGNDTAIVPCLYVSLDWNDTFFIS